MGILNILLALIILPGLWRAYTGISGFFTNHPKLRLNNSAKLIGFLVVVISAGLIASPAMTIGLPAWFRFAVLALYLAYLVTGAVYVWPKLQAVGRKLTAFRNTN